MSIRLMTQIWDNSKQSGTALVLLLALADHANDDGVCWPSISRLAQRARVSERQCQRLLAQLIEDGEIIVERRNGQHMTTIYRVQNKGDVDVTLSGAKGDIQRVKGDIQRAKGDIQRAKGDIAMSPEPSLEPSLEAQGNQNAIAEWSQLLLDIEFKRGRRDVMQYLAGAACIGKRNGRLQVKLRSDRHRQAIERYVEPIIEDQHIEWIN